MFRSPAGSLRCLIACICGMLRCSQSQFPTPDANAIVVKSEGEALLLHVCDDLVFDRFSIEQRNLSLGESWQIVWRSDERVELRSGVTLSTSQPLHELGVIANKPRLVPGDQLRVFIDRDAPDGAYPVVASVFYIPSEGLGAGTWLHSDGTQTELPCST